MSSRFHEAITVDCRWCVKNKGKRGTARAIPHTVPDANGAPTVINVARCLNCDVTPCSQCGERTLKANLKYCQCGALLRPRGGRFT